ncbi:MAG: SMC family ATPase, partial [Armatimonadetes bacterium]|nr:SMC family ATPase [Armatimonadota bacterium]
MRLLSLHLKNFRQYAETQITFQPGVTAIVGVNGAGKTTLLEAIAWALYGSPAIRGSNDSLKRANAPARAPVEATLEFALGSHRYRIHRRPDRAELFVDGSPSPAHSGVQPVSEAVRKLLGMDYRAFFTSYFTGQKELAFLAGMGKQERATAVGRMLGYDRLSRAREKSNQDRLALDKEIAGLEKGMGDAREIADARRAAEDALKAAEKAVAAAKKRLARAQAALETLAPKYELSTERKARYDDMQQQMNLADRDRAGADAEIQSHRRELSRLDGLERELREIAPEVEAYRRAEQQFDAMRPLLKFESERRQLLGEEKGLKSEIEKLHPQADGLDAARSVLQSLQFQRTAAEEALTQAQKEFERADEEWKDRRNDLVTERKSLESRLKELNTRRSRVDSLGQSGACPT